MVPLPPSYLQIAACDALGPFKLGREHSAAGRFQEAIQATFEALQCAEQSFGSTHENTAFILDDLAVAHLRLQRFDDAQSYSERALAIMSARRTGTMDHAKLATNLASIHAARGQYGQAEPHYREAFNIIRNMQDADPRSEAGAARNLAIAQSELSRHEASKALFAEAARLTETIEGANSPAYGHALLDLAGAHLLLDEASTARDLATTAKTLLQPTAAADLLLARVAINRSALGEAETYLKGVLNSAAADPVLKASALYNQAFIQILRGRFIEAETTLKATLDANHQLVGQRHPAVGRALQGLASVQARMGQRDVAARFYREAITLFSDLFGPGDDTVAAVKVSYGTLLKDQDKLVEAEQQVREALAIYRDSPTVRPVFKGYAQAGLGYILHARDDLAGASKAFEQALSLIEETRGPESSNLPPGLIELGLIRMKQGDFEAAGTLIERAIAIRDKDAARTPWGLAKALNALARLRQAEGKGDEALKAARQAIDVIRDRLDQSGRSFAPSSIGETLNEREIFERYLEIAFDREAGGGAGLVDTMFEVAQFPNLTDTAAAIGRMSSRLAQGGDDLGLLMRKRQDKIEDWRSRDYQLTDILASGGSKEREQRLRAELQMLDQAIKGLDRQIEALYPDYAALANTRAVSVGDVQALLEPDEAVLLQITGEDLTHLILLRKTTIDLARTDLGKKELDRRVEALRAGVEVGDGGLKSLSTFDVASAHRLYQTLFDPFADELAGIDHLMVVFDAAMQHLPPSMLLRSPAPASPEAYGRFRERATKESFAPFRDLDYLGKHLTMSTLPSIGSLRALRVGFQAPTGRRPFIGFGNPAFEGDPSQGQRISLDDLPMTAPTKTRRAASRNLPPLPESEIELLDMAGALDASDGDVFLRERANETAVKQANLAAYKTIAFATHAVAPSRQAERFAEPALILPVPESIHSEDDGILTESEIARLNLNADWVILSACNTAAPTGRPGAEALSGLARAFFLAGSKALLVTHWAVDSSAATALTTGTMQALKTKAAHGRAEALRIAMTSLIDHPDALQYSHPAFWAAFAVVGEGRN